MTHSYTPELLEEIKAAHRKQGEAEEKSRSQTFEEQIEEAEQVVSDEPPYTLSDHCGLKPEQFPPTDQLSEKEMQMVCDALKEMFWSWSISVDLPKKIPAEFAYPLIVDILNQKAMIVNNGIIGFDFCTGVPHNCELKEHCPCREIGNEEK